jgi:hypothetical protein
MGWVGCNDGSDVMMGQMRRVECMLNMLGSDVMMCVGYVWVESDGLDAMGRTYLDDGSDVIR